MTPTAESWRPVVGYEGYYEVSDQGRVRSLDRYVMIPGHKQPFLRRGRLMTLGSDGEGRRTVRLTAGGKREQPRVYVLVLTAFIGARPPGLVGCHSDGNPANDALTNLRWDTYSGNNRDTVKHGNHHHAKKTHCKRGHALQVPNLREGDPSGRVCLACSRAKNAEWYARSKGIEFDIQASSDEHYVRIMEEKPCLTSS